MPFARPTLEDLRLRIKSDLMSQLPGTDALLRRNNLGIIGDVEAGATHLLYGRLDWSFRQLFPDTAEGEYLERWASIWGVYRLPAETAKGTVQFPAQAGTSVPIGAVIARRDGVLFDVTTGGSVDNTSGMITVTVEAEIAGSAGNTDPGVQMTMNTTQPGVTPLGTVLDPGLAGGAPEESDDLLRTRLLLRIKAPPHGGSASDYVQWALEVPGVTRAWCYPVQMGPGTVVVRFMMDDVRADAQGIPQPGDVALVQQHIAAVAPVTAEVYVVAPVALPVNVTIAALVTDTPDTRSAINAQLLDLFVRQAEPGVEMFASQFVGAINGAPGVQRFNLITPLLPIQPDVGQICILGVLTFQ
jgi:uncharacterized phage protein gp47/JayE